MANSTDSDVQLPVNQGGPLVDTSQLQTGAGVVQRQRVAEADATDALALASVNREGERFVRDAGVRELLFLCLQELIEIKQLLATAGR